MPSTGFQQQAMSAQSQTVSLIDRLFYHAEINPTHDAVVTTNFVLSYKQLAKLVYAQVKQFIDVGIDETSIVGIKCADDTQHLVACLAATYVGATSCTIPDYEEKLNQDAVIKRCGVTDVVDESNIVNPSRRFDDIESETVIEHVAEAKLLFSTSGTTGEPKLVLHHDSDLVAQAHRHVSSTEERFVCLASMQHNFAKRHRLYCVAVGATNVFPETDQHALVAQCLSLKVNVIHVSAFQAQELLAIADIGALADVRLKLGGSHVPESLRQQLKDNITKNLQAGYGTTETGAIAFTDPNDLVADASESVGKPLPGIEIRTVTPAREPLGLCEPGELAIRCEGMFRGYLGKPELTAAQLEDGWFYTGDMGYLDEQQRIYLRGRSDDMFVFSSMNIYPQEIETEICQFPDVVDAVVLPKESSLHGSIPVAQVVFADNTKPDLTALKDFVRQRVGVRSPRQFTVVDEIPRNATGKVIRNNDVSVAIEDSKVRRSIVQALSDSNLKNKLDTELIAAFEKGEKDITLRELGLDSMARMELLVMLETVHDTVIMPQKFARLSSLNDIVSYVLAPPELFDALSYALARSQREELDKSIAEGRSNALIESDVKPHVVSLFQRMFVYCHTVAQLHKVLATLEQRLTPAEIYSLHDWHSAKQLIPFSDDEKFLIALNHWLHNLKRMMQGSGKEQAETFSSRKITPTVTHLTGSSLPASKTLIICFAAKGCPDLLIPNSVLMQYTDSTRYDLLIIAEPLNASYRLGVPSLGKNVNEVIEWLANLDLIARYKNIRTLGASAGGYPAVLAAYRLGAELVVSVGGRFPSERYLNRIIKMIVTTWQARRKENRIPVLMSYDKDKTRDRTYARTIGGLCSGNLLALEFTDGKVGHKIFESLVNRGDLALYLEQTIFAEVDNAAMTTRQKNMMMSFPGGHLRPF